MALAPLKIAALQQSQPITRDQQGNPATWFMRALNDTFKNIVAAVNAVIEAQNAADAAQAAADAAQGTAETAQDSADTAQTTATSAVTDAATAQTQADAAFALASNSVQKNGTATPGYSGYTAPAISNPPTQAEVQAVANALQSASSALASVISKLHSIGAFS